MFVLPAWLIAIGTGLAGVAWILFARSQRGRKLGGVLWWLSLPFLALTGIYGWFALFDVPIDIRMAQSRWGTFTISMSQAIILLFLSWYESRTQRS